MGDRALIQLTNGRVCSPVLYLHWGGSDVAAILQRTQEQMRTRVDDVDYAFARLVQQATADDPDGSTGIGVWNAAEPLKADASQGDAGCFLVNISYPEWTVQTGGGYGWEYDDEENEDTDKPEPPFPTTALD